MEAPNFDSLRQGDPKEEEKKQEMEAMRQEMLRSVLTPEAKERLNRISLVKKDKARQIENQLITMARSGRLGDKIDESRVIAMLEALDKKKAVTKVTIKRRGIMDDDSDIDDDF